MKKKYNLTFSLSLFFALLFNLHTTAQVRIVEVDPATERVKLHNYGTTTVNIANYWFCSQIVYGQLSGMSVISGSLNLAAGADVELTSSVSLDAAADLGLYNTNSFGSTTAMQDFTQWGGSFSFPSGRENVAVAKGIWTAGTFINLPAPYEYIGDGAQNGSPFWDSLLSVEDNKLDQFRIIHNPSSTKLLLSLPKQSETYVLDVFDVLGKKLLSKVLSSESPAINVSKWNNGMYLIRLSTENEAQTKRFIKQ